MTSHPFELGLQEVQVAQATTSSNLTEQNRLAIEEALRRRQEGIARTEEPNWLTTMALGEEGGRWITEAVGENGEGWDLIGDPPPEEPWHFTTAIGENGGWDDCRIAQGDFIESRSWCDQPNPGNTQDNPFLPDRIGDNGGIWWFDRVPSRRWFDPPTTFGFGYEMESDSLFASILDFPTGFDAPFTVSVGDEVLGQFLPGQTTSFIDILGEGVSHFTVTGISPTVDSSDPTAFPLKLAFDTDYASFQMYAIEAPDSTSVPESTSVLSLVLLSLFVALRQRFKRK